MSKVKLLYVYEVKVLPDDGTEDKATYVVTCKKPIPHKWLRIAGLVLDQGLNNSTFDDLNPTAEMYANVERVRGVFEEATTE